LSVCGYQTTDTLLTIVGGNREHLERTLSAMRRDGLIKRVYISRGDTCLRNDNGKVIARGGSIGDLLAHGLPQRGFQALTAAERDIWLTPFMSWKRFGNEFVGSRIGTGHSTGSSTGITTIAKQRTELDRFRSKDWFTLGDERAIVALFPEFGGSDATDNR
jgi:hypothetical protein